MPRLQRSTSKGLPSHQHQTPCPKSRKQKKPRRHVEKLTPAFTEIRLLRQTTHLLIQRAPFHRVVREVMQKRDPEMRITKACLEALQEACELYLVQLLDDAYTCTIHRGRVTLHQKDVELVRYLRGANDVGSNRRSSI